jgi:ABC-type nitrate/sulfonate/bicarbonate transport system substrate-binding protein
MSQAFRYVISINDKHRVDGVLSCQEYFNVEVSKDARSMGDAVSESAGAMHADKSNPAILRVGGGAVGFNWLPVIAAERQGMFARSNLAIEIKRLGAVDKATAAVKNGELDLVITPPEGAIRDCVNGGNLRIIAGNVNRLPLSLIANPRIRRIEDLRGARLGTSSLTEGTALYTLEVLRQHGLHYPADYQFSVVGVHPARWKALQEGTIDAAVQLIPLNFVAEDDGYANLGEVTDYIPQIVFTAFIVDHVAARTRRKHIIEFLRGVMEGTRWVHDPANDESLLALTKELTQAEGKYGRQALDYMRVKNVFSADLSIPDAAFAKSIELMQKAGLADEQLMANARGVLDDSYRLAALKLT